MVSLQIIIGVVYFLQISHGQLNNGPNLDISAKQNNPQGPDKVNSLNIANNSNLNGNHINLAAYNSPQNKLSTLQSINQVSDLFTQSSKAPVEKCQNIIHSSNQKQQSLQQFSNFIQSQPNLQQQNRLLSPGLLNTLAYRNSLQQANLNNIQVAPSNDPIPNPNILPPPNIDCQQTLQNTNNFVIRSDISNPQSIISPSTTITTSLSPLCLPKSLPSTDFIQKLENIQDSPVSDPKKIYLALRESPKAISNPNPISYTYSPNTKTHNQKSLNLKKLLPLILNLINDKNEDCPCCFRCNCCCNNKNHLEAPHIDTGYSRQKKYGLLSGEVVDDSESEEINNTIVRKNKSLYKDINKNKYFHKNNIQSEEDDYDSLSEED